MPDLDCLVASVKVVYPGTFNPWHKGHAAVLAKAQELFGLGSVWVAQLYDRDKPQDVPVHLPLPKSNVIASGKALVTVVREHKFNLVVRGLRNATDFQHEQTMQYWNEDLGLQVPIVYLICPRELVHVSSSAVRQVIRLKAEGAFD
jgi:pantetheine-phosphate adenylyltransferase